MTAAKQQDDLNVLLTHIDTQPSSPMDFDLTDSFKPFDTAHIPLFNSSQSHLHFDS